MRGAWIGWLASVVFLARLVPQPVRLWRTGVCDGVSPLASLNATASAVAWAVYGFTVDLVVVWAVSLLALVPSVMQVILLRERATRRDVVGGGLWIAVIVAAWSTGLLAGILAVTVVVNQGPQVWAAVRGADLDGIAPATWWIAVSDAVLWGSYGVAVGDAALMGYGTVLLAAATTILTRLAVTAPARRYAVTS